MCAPIGSRSTSTRSFPRADELHAISAGAAAHGSGLAVADLLRWCSNHQPIERLAAVDGRIRPSLTVTIFRRHARFDRRDLRDAFASRQSKNSVATRISAVAGCGVLIWVVKNARKRYEARALVAATRRGRERDDRRELFHDVDLAAVRASTIRNR